jgi:hypothetical protein
MQSTQPNESIITNDPVDLACASLLIKKIGPVLSYFSHASVASKCRRFHSLSNQFNIKNLATTMADIVKISQEIDLIGVDEPYYYHQQDDGQEMAVNLFCMVGLVGTRVK